MEVADSSANSCYTRLEQRIRGTYSKVFAFGDSIVGHMALSFVAEYIGAFVGQWCIDKTISEISSTSSHYPLVTRSLISLTGVVVLQGMLQGQRCQLGRRTSKIDWKTTLVGAVCLSAIWELVADQTFPYVLNLNQMVAKILGGYVGLVVSGVVPVFWDNTHWRSSYAMRMIRYEAVGLAMTYVIVSPQEWVTWTIFIIPRFIFCSMVKTSAYNSDRTIPFIKQCVCNIRLAKKQFIPLLIHMAIQKYAGEEQQALIEKMTKTFCQGLKQSLLMLFPPLSYFVFVDKTLPTRCKQQKWVEFQRKTEHFVKMGIRRGMHIGVSEGLERVEESGPVLVRWGLRTILLFGRLLNKFPRIKEIHQEWKAAFLERRDNDREIKRRLLIEEMNQVMEKRYGAGDNVKDQTIRLLCKSKRLMHALCQGMEQIQVFEKNLIGCALTKKLHLHYWRAACEIYLPYFVKLAVHHHQERSQVPSLLEEKELLGHIEALICHAYIDFVLPDALAPWMRKAVQQVVRGVCAFQEVAMNLACAPEQQTWVPEEEGAQRMVTERVKEAHFDSLHAGEAFSEGGSDLMADVPQLAFSESGAREEKNACSWLAESHGEVVENKAAPMMQQPKSDPDLDEWVCVTAQ